jgi:hypothetical protein
MVTIFAAKLITLCCKTPPSYYLSAKEILMSLVAKNKTDVFNG